jgi:hypothetical protein
MAVRVATAMIDAFGQAVGQTPGRYRATRQREVPAGAAVPLDLAAVRAEPDRVNKGDQWQRG